MRRNKRRRRIKFKIYIFSCNNDNICNTEEDDDSLCEEKEEINSYLNNIC